jgi:hypothetical protein
MVGYPIEEMPPGVFPFDHTKSEEEIAARQIKLLQAGVVGEPTKSPDSSPEIQQLYFDIIARAANTKSVNGGGLTYQWRFTDAQPWHVVIDNGSTRAEPGEAANPDLVLESSWADWVAASMGEEDARVLMLKRRIRPQGSLRELLRMRKVFPPR